jgi:hypothetical protein
VAEIRIQRKRRPKVWPWVVGALALVLLLLIPFRANEDDTAVAPVVSRVDTTPPSDTSSRVTTTAAGAVAPAPSAPRPAADTVVASDTASTESALDRFLASPDSSRGERAHREYTSTGLRGLADELETRGASAAGVATIRAHADSLRTSSARKARHADYTRTAFLAAVREIDELRGRSGGAAVDTARLRAAAWAIRPDRRLLAQRRRVQTFFESARDAMHALSRRP